MFDISIFHMWDTTEIQNCRDFMKMIWLKGSRLKKYKKQTVRVHNRVVSLKTSS